MEQSETKSYNSTATQTETTVDKGKRLDPLDLARHQQKFTAYNQSRNPFYRKKLDHLFKENYKEVTTTIKRNNKTHKNNK